MGYVDKIKDPALKKRIQGYVDAFPRDPENSPVQNENVEKLMVQLCKDDDVICLPKDNVIKVDQSIEKPPDIVLPSRVVEDAIRRASHRVVMNFCICRESMQCKNHPIELGCIFLGDAAKRIHPELGREATVEQALDAARQCRESGLVHTIGRSGFDPVWLAVGPPVKLLTICNCCPCCCLTRTTPYSPTGSHLSRMPGVTVRVTDDCNGCGTCADEACIFKAVTIEDGRAVMNKNCRGCGRCATLCPEGAIEVVVEDPDFIPKTLERLSKIDFT